MESERIKIIIVGDKGVRKTEIIHQFFEEDFKDINEGGLGIDFYPKKIKYKGKDLRLQIWDTSGQEKYRGLIPSYARNADIVFLIYDIGSKKTFDNLPNWIKFIYSIEKTKIVICGNKIDLKYREVNKKEGEKFAEKEGLGFFEVCSENRENIKNMFYNSIAELFILDGEINNKKEFVKELFEENGINIINNDNFFEENNNEKNNNNIIDNNIIKKNNEEFF